MVAVALGVICFAPAASGGGSIEPRPGTYSGAGTMVDDNSHGMRVGFIFDGTTVDVRILGFEAPGCNGFTSVPPATVADGRFQTSSSSSHRTTVLKGRWVRPGMVKGSMTMTVPSTTSCGEPGTYFYKYAARRYGGA